MELIPAIDLKEGRCVRLFQGDFAAETVYAEDPEIILDQYVAFGASRIHVVDLDGARDGALANRTAILKLARRKGIKLQVGGGLRTFDRVRHLLDAGIERAVIGSMAATTPGVVTRWFESLGPDRLVLAFDVRMDDMNTPRLTTHGWTEQSKTTLWDAVESFLPSGLKHVLCTDISRDGALTGPNTDLYKEAAKRFPQIKWQASGGVANAADLHALRACGASAAISGKALLENRISLEELKPFLPNASSPA
ncbi:MAG: 1-(5-phosphoribosyl)-5-[(5-phosphoribosylamino)methylideneamino]imidazole-4-carboxamide isomerase [Steroidobacteraceae bacterium]